MADRVAVFMDYQNVHGTARRAFFGEGVDPAEGHVDPLAVAKYLCKRRARASELAKVCVYRGRPNPERQPGAARANDRQFDAWTRSPLVQVTRRNLRYPLDYPNKPAEEKGIDVAIAVDMIHVAIQDQTIDALILFSSDNDLLPALELIVKHKFKHVEVAAWEGANRLRFDGTQLPWCHTINESQYETLRDKTDYAAPVERPAFPAALRPRI